MSDSPCAHARAEQIGPPVYMDAVGGFEYPMRHETAYFRCLDCGEKFPRQTPIRHALAEGGPFDGGGSWLPASSKSGDRLRMEDGSTYRLEIASETEPGRYIFEGYTDGAPGELPS